jgi:hypothetical protein
MKPDIFVTKASGNREPFSMQKLRNSLKRAKATPAETDLIIEALTPKLYQGISTKKIYSEAYRLLRVFSKSEAARYHLKRGIMELGPSGFPFEKFIGKLFENLGYTVLIGQIVQGKCVNHEIDVIGRKENEILLMECKYRNRPGITVDVQTPLYINSRFEDVLASGAFKIKNEKIKGWVVTNSRFTGDAIKYGKCQGLNLLGWDYPAKNSLRDMIDRSGLYPLTCLTGLTKQEKQWFLNKHFVLVKEILQNEEVLLKAGLTLKRVKTLMEEGRKLCLDRN